jgi:hypothetical protein
LERTGKAQAKREHPEEPRRSRKRVKTEGKPRKFVKVET